MRGSGGAFFTSPSFLRPPTPPPLMHSFTIKGTPVGQGRPRAVRQGRGVRVYDPPRSREYKEKVKEALLEQVPRHPDGNALYPKGCPVSVSIALYYDMPKGRHRKGSPPDREWKTTKPDVDNVAKGILDAMNGIVFEDDSQVTHLTVLKFTSSQKDTEEGSGGRAYVLIDFA